MNNSYYKIIGLLFMFFISTIYPNSRVAFSRPNGVYRTPGSYFPDLGEGKISLKTIEDTAINKLRKAQSVPTELEDLEIDQEDDFDKIYKGEISKSGAAILPSKRVRKIPEKMINIPNTEENIDKKVNEIIEQGGNDSTSEEKNSTSEEKNSTSEEKKI